MPGRSREDRANAIILTQASARHSDLTGVESRCPVIFSTRPDNQFHRQ